MRELVIVPTGIANTASVTAAFTRLGVAPTVTDDRRDIERAHRLVLPGVGSFGAAAKSLDRLGVRRLLLKRLNDDRATLAICVGMQLLARTSTESPGARGLGVLAGEVSRFSGSARAPQLGWNLVSPHPESRYLAPGWAYFANSYRLAEAPQGWAPATSDHGGEFVAALERGSVLACQFHPELSGTWGSRVLSRWLAAPGGLS